jgi:hypothetical protein
MLIFSSPETEYLIPDNLNITLPQFLAQIPSILPLSFSNKEKKIPNNPKKFVQTIVFIQRRKYFNYESSLIPKKEATCSGNCTIPSGF